MTVADLIATLHTLPAEAPVDWTLPELADGIPAMIRAQSQLAALRMQAVAAFDARGGAQVSGYRTTADWLGKVTGISHPGAMVNTARALRDELPHTAAALARGQISEDHVAVIRRAHRMLGEDFGGFEKTLVDFAGQHSLPNLRGYTDLLIAQYRPDDFDDDTETARSKRKLHLSASLDGWWHLSGLLDPETGQRLHAALDVYADRTDDTDDRSPAQRRADAIAEIADKALNGIDRPSGRGHVLIKITLDTPTDADTMVDNTDNPTGTDADTTTTTGADADTTADSTGVTGPTPDIIDLTDTTTDTDDTGPTTDGFAVGPWPVGTTITPADSAVLSQTRSRWPSGAPMTRPDLAKATCSAQVATVVGTTTDTGWQPVSVGMTERYATAAQRLALQARDGDTCIHADCTVHVNRTIAHHLIHWADGGPTDAWNLALLCLHHHDQAHKGKLVIVINPDGSYTATPRE